MSKEKPREYPETAEGQEAFDRFRELTRRLVNVPKAKLREPQAEEQAP
jgi:hypothetical protein